MNTVRSVRSLDPECAKYRDLSFQVCDDVYISSTTKMEAESFRNFGMQFLRCTSSYREDRNLSTQHVTKCKHNKTILVSSLRYCFWINSCMPASNSLVQTAQKWNGAGERASDLRHTKQCSVTEISPHSGGIYCLHFRGSRVSEMYCVSSQNGCRVEQI